MRRHKHLKRLERLRDTMVDNYGKTGWGDFIQSDFENEGLWLIWVALLKDIKECGFSPDFKIDGLRLYYYNELWKKVNNNDHALENIKIQLPQSHDPRAPKWARTLMDEFEDPLDRAERLAKQPLPGYMWPEAK
jgi:hypothetical protein